MVRRHEAGPEGAVPGTGYTRAMQRRVWQGTEVEHELAELAGAPAGGPVVVVFGRASGGTAPAWEQLEPVTRARAVSVADVTSAIDGAARDIALCCDLVYLRPTASFVLPPGDSPPSAGLVWAAGRAGRQALARVLLDPAPIAADEAVSIGLARQVVADGEPLPLPDAASVAALVAARDLGRTGAAGDTARTLEHATFRWLFAVGDPEEGARAFLDKREPRFGTD